MFEKCIKCDRLGESCVPNLMLLPFADLIQWCGKRQKYLDWTNPQLADKSKVPLGTITRIKGGKYTDAMYLNIKSILIALIGGTNNEFPCNELIEKELMQMEELEKQAAKLSVVEKENQLIRDEAQKKIDFLLDEIKSLRSEIDYLRYENTRKSKIIDKFFETTK